MLGEILVALITTAGMVWVAYVSLQASGRRASRRYSEPLRTLSGAWGRTRGVAEAAVESCVRALEQRREGTSGSALAAARRDELFDEEARRSQQLLDALNGEAALGGDGLHSEVLTYQDAVKKFRMVLRELGDRIDVMGSEPARPSEIGIDRHLRRLEEALPAFDMDFYRCLNIYLQRKDGLLRYRARRRLRRQAKERYESSRHGGRGAFAHLDAPGPADPSAQGDGARPDGAEPPPCGYCIWRCPHAPDLAVTPGDRTTASPAGMPQLPAAGSARV